MQQDPEMPIWQDSSMDISRDIKQKSAADLEEHFPTYSAGRRMLHKRADRRTVIRESKNI